MAPRDTKADEPNEVVFQYLPRRGDNCSWAGTNAGLQHVGRVRAGGAVRRARRRRRVRLALAHPAAEGQRPGEHAAAADAARRGEVRARPGLERGGAVREYHRPRAKPAGHDASARGRGVLVER